MLWILCFSFSGILSSLNCLLPHGQCCLFLCCCGLSRRLFNHLFVFCLFYMTGVCQIIFSFFFFFYGDNFGLVFSGIRSSLTLSVTLSIVTTLFKIEWAFYLVCFQTWQVLLTCFLTHGPCNSLPCYGILVNRYFNFIYSSVASFCSVFLHWN